MVSVSSVVSDAFAMPMITWR